MPAKDAEELKLVLIRLYAEDVLWLKQFYGNLKYNRVIRLLVRKHRNAVERKRASALALKPEAEEEMEIDVE